MQRKLWWWIGLAVLVLLGIWLFSCPTGAPRSSALLRAMISTNPLSQAADSLGIQPIEIPACRQTTSATAGRSIGSLTCSGSFGLAEPLQEKRLLDAVEERVQSLAEEQGFSMHSDVLEDEPDKFHLVFDRILLDVRKGRMTTAVSVRGFLVPQGGSARETVYRCVLTADELSILWK